jgi:hypothetical protein
MFVSSAKGRRGLSHVEKGRLPDKALNNTENLLSGKKTLIYSCSSVIPSALPLKSLPC